MPHAQPTILPVVDLVLDQRPPRNVNWTRTCGQMHGPSTDLRGKTREVSMSGGGLLQFRGPRPARHMPRRSPTVRVAAGIQDLAIIQDLSPLCVSLHAHHHKTGTLERRARWIAVAGWTSHIQLTGATSDSGWATGHTPCVRRRRGSSRPICTE